MWICQKCKRQSDSPGRICRACGGIMEETQATSASLPDSARDDPAKYIAAANSLEEGQEWQCCRCGEINPGNFDVCWKCLAVKADEQTDGAKQLPNEIGKKEEETAASTADSIVTEIEPDGEDPNTCGKCPRCGSRKVIPDVKICDQGQGSDGELQVIIFGNPEALVFKDRLNSELRANICGQCGHVELGVTNPEELYRHYLKSLGSNRPSNHRESSFPCIQCRMSMAEGSTTCPYCGASQSAY